MDPYRVLGLDPAASQAEVKRAYRRLAKALHPDAAGEAALPRFLELQDAYERLTGTKVRTVRAPGARGSGAGSEASSRSRAAGGDGAAGGFAGQGAEGFREPWRADPARARAAREQARARGATRGSAGGAAPGSDGAARRSTGGPGARSGPATGGSSDVGGGNRTDGQSRAGTRRRASRKATLGSTSYDEAREPTDRHWAGASWYGPTTGEYWIVNPREYADPRKHGPGYTSRGRAGQSTSDAAQPEPDHRTARPAEDLRSDDGSGEPPTWAPSSGGGAGSIPRPEPTIAGAARPPAGSEPDLGHVLGSPAILPSAAWRRLGLALLAWPPLGLAAATAIGQATGCLSYSASCDGADPLLPWLAQVLIVGLLLASPWLAGLLGAGTIAALVALVPGVGIITALGGASSPEGGPVLAGWLALAWLAGVALAARRALRGSPSAGGSRS